MSSAETEEEVEAPGIADYDTGVLQLGDTELDGVPEEEIVEGYEDAGIDAVVYHGDASKKQSQEGWADEGEYIEQLQDTYESLNSIGESLGVDVLTLPGNHEPIAGNHYDDEEYMEEVESMLGEEYEGFEEFEGNAYEFFLESDEIENDNITDFSGSVYETEGGVSLVGLGTHMEPELDEEAFQLLQSDLGLEELGYGEEDLEAVAEELSEEPGFEYGWIGDLPYIGDWIQKIGDKIAGWLDYGAVDVEPEDVNLEDFEELGEEFMTEEHMQYLEDMEELKESEEYGEFEEKIGKIEELIGSAEGEVAIFNHGVPYGEEAPHGSMALREITERHGDSIRMIGGGHDHNPGVYEMNDVPIVNSATVYTEIGFGDELYTEQHGIASPEPEPVQEQASEEEMIMRQAHIVGQIDQAGGPEEFLDDRLDEEMPEQQRRIMEAQIEDLWENREQVMEQAQGVAEETAEPPAPDEPGEGESGSEEAAA